MPTAKHPKSPPQDQHAKFIETAKRLGTDDDPERFKEKVKRLASAPIRPEDKDGERREKGSLK